MKSCAHLSSRNLPLTRFLCRWELDRVTSSGTARCKKWAVCRVVARERQLRRKGGPKRKKTINRLKETLRIGG